MDTTALDVQLDAFVSAAYVARQAGASAAPIWDLELVLAHVAANERLIALSIAEQLAGGREGYRNDSVLDERLLRAAVRSANGFDDLLEQVRQGARELIAMLETYQASLDEPIHVHIRDGDEVMVDEPWTVEQLLIGNFRVHLRLHRRQLEELAGSTGARADRGEA